MKRITMLIVIAIIAILAADLVRAQDAPANPAVTSAMPDVPQGAVSGVLPPGNVPVIPSVSSAMAKAYRNKATAQAAAGTPASTSSSTATAVANPQIVVRPIVRSGGTRTIVASTAPVAVPKPPVVNITNVIPPAPQAPQPAMAPVKKGGSAMPTWATTLLVVFGVLGAAGVTLGIIALATGGNRLEDLADALAEGCNRAQGHERMRISGTSRRFTALVEPANATPLLPPTPPAAPVMPIGQALVPVQLPPVMVQLGPAQPAQGPAPQAAAQAAVVAAPQPAQPAPPAGGGQQPARPAAAAQGQRPQRGGGGQGQQAQANPPAQGGGQGGQQATGGANP